MARVPVSFFSPFLASFWIGAAGGLLLHLGGEAAALDHEARNHAVEHRTVVEIVLRILQEVLHRFRRLVLIQFDADGSQRGLDFKLGVGGERGDAGKKCECKH
jgi:hypothetical protein